ncbi:MAG: hypothetical protein A2Y25_08860 [Candidatus Melainabacteria bacterium GWF2_37_15]|nr:MAG: hypothetical protein A2Y25_08860 [Candidatus Melainabacteria bacterium GWF2_37_15]
MKIELYKQIFENLPEGVAICDAQQSIIDVNKNFEKLTKFSREELIGTSLLDIIKFTKEACNVCEEDDNDAYQIGELKDKDNKLTCIRINQSKTAEKNIIYLVIPFSSIAFLNQAHIDFVSTVSHELRTPLTSIKGFADTLLSAGNSLTQEQQIRFIGIIKSQVDRLTRLVENLLTVSKLEAKQSKPIYKAVEVKKMVESILCSIQHKAKNHKIEVNILPSLPPVWADTDKLEQVLMNLVDNAVKYSNPGTMVNIEAGFVPNDTDTIEIKVKDQGFGIPKEHISKIFTKFSRIDSPLTRGVQGTGLGLYITKSLVQSMKGDIVVESSDKGSMFTLTLPVASPEIYTQQKFQERE